MELPFLVKTCDLFVYLNLHFRSYQFEDANILQKLDQLTESNLNKCLIWLQHL